MNFSFIRREARAVVVRCPLTWSPTSRSGPHIRGPGLIGVAACRIAHGCGSQFSRRPAANPTVRPGQVDPRRCPEYAISPDQYMPWRHSLVWPRVFVVPSNEPAPRVHPVFPDRLVELASCPVLVAKLLARTRSRFRVVHGDACPLADRSGGRAVFAGDDDANSLDPKLSTTRQPNRRATSRYRILPRCNSIATCCRHRRPLRCGQLRAIACRRSFMSGRGATDFIDNPRCREPGGHHSPHRCRCPRSHPAATPC